MDDYNVGDIISYCDSYYGLIVSKNKIRSMIYLKVLNLQTSIRQVNIRQRENKDSYLYKVINV